MTFTPATHYLRNVEAAMAYLNGRQGDARELWLAIKSNGAQATFIEGAVSFSIYGKEVICLNTGTYVFSEDGLTYEFPHFWQWLCYLLAVHW